VGAGAALPGGCAAGAGAGEHAVASTAGASQRTGLMGAPCDGDRPKPACRIRCTAG